MEVMMKRTLIRYKTKPELADKNAELISGVFAELKAAKPEGVRYLSLRLEDDTFVHFVETESDSANALPGLVAFKAFQSGIRDRCIEPRSPAALQSSAIIGCCVRPERWARIVRRLNEIGPSMARNTLFDQRRKENGRGPRAKFRISRSFRGPKALMGSCALLEMTRYGQEPDCEH
jgi:hypothetical protein